MSYFYFKSDDGLYIIDSFKHIFQIRSQFRASLRKKSSTSPSEPFPQQSICLPSLFPRILECINDELYDQVECIHSILVPPIQES